MVCVSISLCPGLSWFAVCDVVFSGYINFLFKGAFVLLLFFVLLILFLLFIFILFKFGPEDLDMFFYTLRVLFLTLATILFLALVVIFSA